MLPVLILIFRERLFILLPYLPTVFVYSVLSSECVRLSMLPVPVPYRLIIVSVTGTGIVHYLPEAFVYSLLPYLLATLICSMLPLSCVFSESVRLLYVTVPFDACFCYWYRTLSFESGRLFFVTGTLPSGNVGLFYVTDIVYYLPIAFIYSLLPYPPTPTPVRLTDCAITTYDYQVYRVIFNFSDGP